ncbi:MAG: hypothetical protein IJT62_07255 [Oscillospiraceae bacterium]|nr:hypothetical protein [Oscillospiraceae bacterium]
MQNITRWMYAFIISAALIFALTRVVGVWKEIARAETALVVLEQTADGLREELGAKAP